jgi:hypothetical protein
MRLFFSALSAAIVVVVSVPSASALMMKDFPQAANPHAQRHANRKKKQPAPIEHTDARLRNEQRKKDLTNIGNALYRFKKKNGFIAPKVLPTYEAQEICRFDAKDCTGLLDLKEILTPYLEQKTMPVDPSAPKDGNSTRYTVYKDYKNRVFLKALDAEDGWLIREQH